MRLPKSKNKDVSRAARLGLIRLIFEAGVLAVTIHLSIWSLFAGAVILSNMLWVGGTFADGIRKWESYWNVKDGYSSYQREN